MTLKGFTLGLIASFGIPWLLILVFPSIGMSHLDPVRFEGKDIDGGEGVYLPPRDGRITLGSEVYGQEGCYYCHSQLVRPTYAGADLWRDEIGGLAKSADNPQDTRRETIPQDYDGETVAHVGLSRVGPDLSNFGRRIHFHLKPGAEVTPEEWILRHLYDPRTNKGYRQNDTQLHAKSVCPGKKGLFETVDAVQGRAEGLDVEGLDDGTNVIPTARAKALAGYLRSLKRDPLNAPLPSTLNHAPGKPAAK